MFSNKEFRLNDDHLGIKQCFIVDDNLMREIYENNSMRHMQMCVDLSILYFKT